jgi:endonuclease/exonuclease/phosphatase family metal-dependent hydrolase
VSRPGGSVRVGAEPHENLVLEGTLRIATLNLLHGHPEYAHQAERLDRAGAILAGLSLDILCLQEASRTPVVDNAARWLADSLGMSGVYARANGNYALIRFEEGEALLTRVGVRGVGWGELKPEAGFFENRIAVWGTLETNMGTVVVFCTHLTNGVQAVNVGQLESLMELVEAQRAGRPAVVAGDFNAEEHEAHMRRLPTWWHDAFRTVNPGEAGGTSVDSGKRIDYVFLVDGAAAGWEILESTTFGGPSISDHMGVLVWANLHSLK